MYYKNMYYEKISGKGKNIIFLHGWGQSFLAFSFFKNYFKDYNLYFLDLPGFGNSKLSYPIGLKEYSELIFSFIDNLNIKEPLLVGHSFGG